MHGHSIHHRGATLAEKLWGSEEDLLHTTKFINAIKLEIYIPGTQKKKKKKKKKKS